MVEMDLLILYIMQQLRILNDVKLRILNDVLIMLYTYVMLIQYMISSIMLIYILAIAKAELKFKHLSR